MSQPVAESCPNLFEPVPVRGLGLLKDAVTVMPLDPNSHIRDYGNWKAIVTDLHDNPDDQDALMYFRLLLVTH